MRRLISSIYKSTKLDIFKTWKEVLCVQEILISYHDF